MIGIVLMSHGKMADGMLDSCKLFFGEEIPQISSVCLLSENSPEEFDKKIELAISEVDSGDGVLILCDLLGGTPCNRCAYILNDRIQVIAGVNLSILLEFLATRDSLKDISELDIETLIFAGTSGLVSLNNLLNI